MPRAWAIAVAVAWAVAPASLEAAPAAAVPIARTLSTAQMLNLSGRALAAGKGALAERILRLLARDPDVQIRSEARYRLGRYLEARNRLGDAALLFRAILDDQPHAQPVRLELARLLDRLGDERGARRALREAQAGGLPPAVARFVDRYSAALRSRKPFGASLELAVAPDSNINHATHSATFGTVIGDFTLDRDARQRSGIGIAERSQMFGRVPLSDHIDLLARASTSANLYRSSRFNDFAISLSSGPELRFGDARVTAEAGATRQWFGGKVYADTLTLGLNLLKPVDRQSQVRAAASVGRVNNKRNDLQDGDSYGASLGYERALSIRAGMGVTAAIERQALRDPGYSSTAGQASLFAYREFGRMTLIATVAGGRLRSDERLLLYPKRRDDRFYRASLGATFRQLTLGNFAPLVRVSAERNVSSVGIYSYRRIRTEFGITRAF